MCLDWCSCTVVSCFSASIWLRFTLHAVRCAWWQLAALSESSRCRGCQQVDHAAAVATYFGVCIPQVACSFFRLLCFLTGFLYLFVPHKYAFCHCRCNFTSVASDTSGRCSALVGWFCTLVAACLLCFLIIFTSLVSLSHLCLFVTQSVTAVVRVAMSTNCSIPFARVTQTYAIALA